MRKSSIKPAHPPIWHPTKEYQWNKAATKDGTLPKRRKFLLLISFSVLSTRRKVVYLDISKAFDTINHVILWKKNWRTSVYQFLHPNGSKAIFLRDTKQSVSTLFYLIHYQWSVVYRREAFLEHYYSVFMSMTNQLFVKLFNRVLRGWHQASIVSYRERLRLCYRKCQFRFTTDSQLVFR